MRTEFQTGIRDLNEYVCRLRGKSSESVCPMEMFMAEQRVCGEQEEAEREANRPMLTSVTWAFSPTEDEGPQPWSDFRRII